MRVSLILFLGLLVLGFYASVRLKSHADGTPPSAGATSSTASTTPGTSTRSSTNLNAELAKYTTAPMHLEEKVDFYTQIKPIFEARCQPCHFNGGKVYSQMPFDRPETIRTLGTKLFTRIKDENERRLIREFLEQN